MAAVLLEVRALCAFTYPDTAVTLLVQVALASCFGETGQCCRTSAAKPENASEWRAISPDFR